MRRLLLGIGWILATAPGLSEQEPSAARVSVKLESAKGPLTVTIDGRPCLQYQYGPSVDLPHFYPIQSPTGKLLTAQQIEPYPHHRSLWFADAVKLNGGRRVSFYDALYTRVNTNDPASPFRDRIRHRAHSIQESSPNSLTLEMELVWEMDYTIAVLDETRVVRIVALASQEYFLDLTFTLTAKYGDVEFVSDWVHYAWPYVRMHPQFSVEHGGRITSSTGAMNQEHTNGRPAQWIDYSNTIDNLAEGLAIFSHPQNAAPHLWLTRDYGTFGPRRHDSLSGVPFTLRRGERISQRVGILVHRGDVVEGRVGERYTHYVRGEL